MTNAQYEGLVGRVAEFIHEKKIGHLPEDCPVDYGSNEESAVLVERIRGDTRKVTEFHPEIDPLLKYVKSTLEEVLKCGIQSYDIEFFHGIFGVIAERCYQDGVNLPEEILRVRDSVYAEYKKYFDSKAMELTQRTHTTSRRRARRLAEALC